MKKMAVFIIKIITQDKKTYLLNSLNFMQNTNVENNICNYGTFQLLHCNKEDSHPDDSWIPKKPRWHQE